MKERILMFKLLLKKHLLEIGSFFVKNRKTGKKQSPEKVILFVSLWLLIAFSLFMAGLGINPFRKNLLPDRPGLVLLHNDGPADGIHGSFRKCVPDLFDALQGKGQ